MIRLSVSEGVVTFSDLRNQVFLTFMSEKRDTTVIFRNVSHKCKGIELCPLNR